MYLKNKKEAEIDIVLEEVEMDEMWSFYHDKKHQIWLWWAVEHRTNTPIAFVFGTREHKYLDEYNVPQKLDTELQNYRDGDIIKITNISSGGNRK